jgi:carboxyl-terminal processing protease
MESLNRFRGKSPSLFFLSILILVLLNGPNVVAQPVMNRDDQALVAGILNQAYHDVKDYYYDPKLKGMDWDARYKLYSGMAARAHNLGEGYWIIAAFLNGLEDSHTFFVPPRHLTQYDSGFEYALIGDACFITHVRSGTDAARNVHVGDQILKLDGYDVNVKDFHDVQYFFNYLVPQAEEKLVLRSPQGEVRDATVKAEVKVNGRAVGIDQLVWERNERKLETSAQLVERGDLAIWKIRMFDGSGEGFNKSLAAARRHKAIILDLRGNPGGTEEALSSVVNALFDHDIKMFDRVLRKSTKPMVVKHHGEAFQGKLIVLVDHGSASASELLARVVQLEHRGTVIGDRTAGAVMESILHPELGISNGERTIYGFSITEANLVMGDGNSLEKVGVIPDELLIPSAAGLAAGLDPVLSHAAELCGVKLDAVDAGKLFPAP